MLINPGWFLGWLWLAVVGGCSQDDAPRLEPVPECSSDEECVEADPRYDRCSWVCEAHVTYCQVSCEVDSDCEGRGLPAHWVYCDIPRPGEGFCNEIGYDYGENLKGEPECVQNVPEIELPTDGTLGGR